MSYSRRRALKHLGLLAATAAGQQFLAGWLPHSTVLAAEDMVMSAPPETMAPPYAPQFFSPTEFSNVEILTEMIIPRDDKPGAKDAHVGDYIDFLVLSAAEFEPEMQTQWRQGLALLEQLSQREFGKAFAGISDPQRVELLTAMSQPEVDRNEHHEGFPFFRLVKETTVDGFYTSRAGLIEALEYKGLTFRTSFPGCTHTEHQR
jgi:Gluconate 2-dehydrogenase subunit 3